MKLCVVVVKMERPKYLRPDFVASAVLKCADVVVQLVTQLSILYAQMEEANLVV